MIGFETWHYVLMDPPPWAAEDVTRLPRARRIVERPWVPVVVYNTGQL
jgi:hypothetical protein